jgi:hypothetical protein
MSNYKVNKPFEHFTVGDEIILNPRQAKYRLLSGHIVEVAGKVVIEDKVDTGELDAAVEQKAFADDGAVAAAPAKKTGKK